MGENEGACVCVGKKMRQGMGCQAVMPNIHNERYIKILKISTANRTNSQIYIKSLVFYYNIYFKLEMSSVKIAAS